MIFFSTSLYSRLLCKQPNVLERVNFLESYPMKALRARKDFAIWIASHMQSASLKIKTVYDLLIACCSFCEDALSSFFTFSDMSREDDFSSKIKSHDRQPELLFSIFDGRIAKIHQDLSVGYPEGSTEFFRSLSLLTILLRAKAIFGCCSHRSSISAPPKIWKEHRDKEGRAELLIACC